MVYVETHPDRDDTIVLRDSTKPHGNTLNLCRRGLGSFVRSVKLSEFDRPFESLAGALRSLRA
jgi:hypothetical protein